MTQVRRSFLISTFVIVWAAVFHYETLRFNYLSRAAGWELPKLKFLYPPAGWIMFFSVGRSAGVTEVYGLRGREQDLLDPHAIFPIRNVLYDNIHRGVMFGVAHRSDKLRFCGYLRRKFPQYDGFAIVYGSYPDIVSTPDRLLRQVQYQCP